MEFEARYKLQDLQRHGFDPGAIFEIPKRGPWQSVLLKQKYVLPERNLTGTVRVVRF